MTAEEKYQYWLEHARYDMKAAMAMLDSGMWAYAVFMCLQSIEKLVKGVYGLFVDADNIPRVHNISRLVREFEGKLQDPVDDEYYDLFEILSGYYLNNRYPDFCTHPVEYVLESDARELCMRAEEVFAWLLTLRP